LRLPVALLPEGFELIVAGHPVPNESSFAAGRAAILDSLSGLSERTLVFSSVRRGSSLVSASTRTSP
jgi:glycerate-2-kinase